MPKPRENKSDTAPDIAAHYADDAATENKTSAPIAASNIFVTYQSPNTSKTAQNSVFESDNARQQNAKRKTPEIWLSTERASALTGIPERTLRDQLSKGKYSARTGEKDALGRGDYEILLDSLPPHAQALYYVERQKASGLRPAPLQVSADERERLSAKFYAATEKIQSRAKRAMAAVIAFNRLLDSGTKTMQAYAVIKEDFDISRNTLNSYIAAVQRFDMIDWLPRLLPEYAGKQPKLEWHPDAWKFFLEHALTPRAKVDIAYRQTKEEGERRGWPKLPNIKTARQAIKDLPQTVVTLAKEGPTALKRLAPTVIRDYSTYALHEVWSMDGRKLDLAVIDSKGRFGEKGRLLRLWLYAFLDFRTRHLVGYAISATLDADLVRDAFLNALNTTGRIIPQRIAPDNGMEVAAKEHTGGAPWRRRGKVREDEIIGTFPQLGIEVDWATVAHGQTKPVERAFRTLKENHETRPELKGAYLGMNPPDRPEECERSKAVPVELVEKLFAETLLSYHRTPHRGDSMDGKSPGQLYAELMQVSATPD